MTTMDELEEWTVEDTVEIADRIWRQSRYNKLSKARPVLLFTLSGKFERRFPSCERASMFVGCQDSSMYTAASGIGNHKYHSIRGHLVFFESEFSPALLDDMVRMSSEAAERSCKSKPVLQLDENTGEVIRRYSSIHRAAKATGLGLREISTAAIRGIRHGGYRWRFESDLPEGSQYVYKKKKEKQDE